MKPANRIRKSISTTMDPELWEKLQLLSKVSRVPVARYVDEAVEDLLLKYHRIDRKTKTP